MGTRISPIIMLTNVSNVSVPSSSSASMMNTSSVAVEPRVEVMFIIFFASLFAASFPTLSKQIPILRIPAIVFFIGKHFGTGVILATAFIHLLDDAFRSLQNPLVRIRYGNIGKWTGLIILGSLLVIFLVEYISTSYVDYLQSKPSAPPTPINSVLPSRSASLKQLSRSTSYENLPRLNISPRPQKLMSTNPELARPTLHTESAILTETTPLLPSTEPITDASFSSPSQLKRGLSAPNIYLSNKSLHSRDHSLHCYHHDRVHHIYTPIIPPATVTGAPIDALANSPRIFRQLGLGHSHAHEHAHEHTAEQANEGEYSDHHHNHHLRIGRRRQIIGLLVLQLGIMIHSLIIGLTLAVTDGSDFTSLTTAILFHQLFEGLSLGIRIASLPPKNVESPIAVEDEETLLSTPPRSSLLRPTRYLPPITSSFDSDSGAPSTSTSLPQHSRITDDPDSQIIGRGIEVQTQESYLRTTREREIHWLEPTLSVLFAVTTPFGMGVGMTLWKERDGSDTIQMLLIKGTMSAISAGMLIYAGTVEMIAGDFVFGDVDGGHGHEHSDPHQGSGGSRPHLDNLDNHHAPDDGKQHQEEQSKLEASTAKKVLAVLSLFTGAAGMVLVGLGE